MENILNIKNLSLSEELIKIFNSYVNKKITDNDLEVLYYKLDECFKLHDLSDFKYNLKSDENCNIIFQPVRELGELPLP